jgi:demethylmenaquinone methyltransferase/2-methoxy-6-polyprenyl-1,4-benzoquinol methylase
MTFQPSGARARGRFWNPSENSSLQWVDQDSAAISQRYDRLARFITIFEWLLWMPSSFRALATKRLELKPGDCVLEIGCGTGRNLSYLQDAVGPSGRVVGVDLSAGMLEHSRALCARRQWDNVELLQCDAAEYSASEPLDAVLFGLSYNTMPHHLAVLRNAWRQLRPGGRLVIMDAKLPPGRGGRLVLPFSVWLMKRTLLGNPYIRPWEDLARLTDTFEMHELMFGSYYVCRGIKP